MRLPETSESLWMGTYPGTVYPKLQGELHVDTAIVGGGISGLTAALLLKRAGKRVAILEARQLASGVTGHTTAHLTEAIDTSYHTIISDFGLEGARLAANASRAAIERIAGFVQELQIDCQFLRVPGYYYTERRKDLSDIKKELEAAQRLGLSVEPVSQVPLPFPTLGGIRYSNQAQFHVRQYLFPLAKAIVGDGCYIFEDSRVTDIKDGEPCQVQTDSGLVTAKDVLVLTNAPLNRVFLQTKISHYRSYVLAFAYPKPLAGLFWDSVDPYHYLRSAMMGSTSMLLVGGEDHKTGHEKDTYESYENLAKYVEERFQGVSGYQFRWSAQVVEPVDGLPFIGRNSLNSHVYVGTGYSGNGMTFGTVAAMLLSDLVLGRPNPWKDLFEATRIKPLASAVDYVVENVDFPANLIADRVRPADAKSVSEVAPGEGKIVSVDGEYLAVYRDPQGQLHALSSICTHLGCRVAFNAAEKTWDCPCHGSRFDPQGKILNGPAISPLEVKHVSDK